MREDAQVIRDLELLPELGGQNWSAVFLQKFEGTVTIWPKSRCTLTPFFSSPALPNSRACTDERLCWWYSLRLVPPSYRSRQEGAGEDDSGWAACHLAKGTLCFTRSESPHHPLPLPSPCSRLINLFLRRADQDD